MPVAGPTYAVGNRDSEISLDETFVSQSFLVAGGDRGLYDATVQLKRTGTTPGSVWLGIFDDDGAGKPNNPLPGGMTPAILASSVSTAFASYTFTFFDQPFLADGERYHLVVINNGEFWDGSNMIEVGVDTSAPTFTDGNVCSRAINVMTWTTLTFDMVFESQYTDVAPAAPTTGDIEIDWPCPCENQQTQLLEVLTNLDILRDTMNSYLRPNSEIYVPDVPSAALFQSDWINQGFSLPVNDGANLLWWASDDEVFGGPYIPVNNGDIFQAEHEYIRGNVYKIYRPIDIGYPLDITDSGLVINTFANPVTQIIDFGTIVVPVASKMYLQFQCHLFTPTGNRTMKMTYFLNGTNNYHTEFGTAAANDCYWEVTTVNNHADFAQPMWAHHAILSPGSYALDIRGTLTAGGIIPAVHLFGGTWPISAYGANNFLIPALYLVAE